MKPSNRDRAHKNSITLKLKIMKKQTIFLKENKQKKRNVFSSKIASHNLSFMLFFFSFCLTMKENLLSSFTAMPAQVSTSASQSASRAQHTADDAEHQIPNTILWVYKRFFPLI